MTRSINSSVELGRIICKLIGLDPNSIATLTLELDPRSPAKVKAEFYVEDEGIGEIKVVEKRFTLTPID